MANITPTLPPDVIRKIFSHSNKAQYVLRTSKQALINNEELNRKQCRRTPTILEFLKYLVHLLTTYTKDSSEVTVSYISGYGILYNMHKKQEIVAYKGSRRLPIITSITLRNNNRDIDVSITLSGLASRNIHYNPEFSTKNIDKYKLPRKNREEVIQQILVDLPFDVDEVIPDTSSLQELLDLRLSCYFTDEEVDQLVLDIYDREKVIKNTLNRFNSVDIEDKLQLLLLLRNFDTRDYFYDTASKYIEEHKELTSREIRIIKKLAIYNHRPVENQNTDDF